MRNTGRMAAADANFWNDAFKENPAHVMVHNPFLSRTVASLAQGTALDLGCGIGENALTLSRLGWRVTGVDWAARAIELAAIRAPNAVFICDDICSWRTEERFDLVMAHFSIPEKKRAARAMLNKAMGLLRPNGHILICEWHKSMEAVWNRGVAKEQRIRNLLLSVRELKELLKDLTIVRREIHRIPSQEVFPDPQDRRRNYQRYMNMMLILAHKTGDAVA